MKPQQVLTQLEREPIVHFGCTWSEIMGQLRKGMLFGFMSSTVFGVFLALLGLDFPIIFVSSMILLVIVTIIVTRLNMHTIAKNRAGKPLYYEKHIGIYRSAAFYQPHRITFQRERNHEYPSQK